MTIFTPFFRPAGTVTKLPVFGVEVEVLLDGRESGGVAACYRVTAPPGTGAPPHRHVAQDEMFHVLEGAFELVCDGATRRLEPGDYAYAPRGTAHAFTAVGAGSNRLLVVSTPAGHERFFQDCATAVAAGTFTPELAQAICAQPGIELLAPRA